MNYWEVLVKLKLPLWILEGIIRTVSLDISSVLQLPWLVFPPLGSVPWKSEPHLWAHGCSDHRGELRGVPSGTVLVWGAVFSSSKFHEECTIPVFEGGTSLNDFIIQDGYNVCRQQESLSKDSWRGWGFQQKGGRWAVEPRWPRNNDVPGSPGSFGWNLPKTHPGE